MLQVGNDIIPLQSAIHEWHELQFMRHKKVQSIHDINICLKHTLMIIHDHQCMTLVVWSFLNRERPQCQESELWPLQISWQLRSPCPSEKDNLHALLKLASVAKAAYLKAMCKTISTLLEWRSMLYGCQLCLDNITWFFMLIRCGASELANSFAFKPLQRASLKILYNASPGAVLGQ